MVHFSAEHKAEAFDKPAIPSLEVSFETHYDETKVRDHQKILTLIEAAELELRDLKLRKEIMEADFSTLTQLFHAYLVEEQAISTLAKQTLVEYLSYEFLRPLAHQGLNKGNNFNLWSAKHFQVLHHLDEKNRIIFEIQMNGLDQRVVPEFIPLIAFDLEHTTVEIFDHQIAVFIRLWYEEGVYSRNQLALFNHDLNQLLNYARQLGFEVERSLLDNTYQLDTHFTSQNPVNTKIIDQLFIDTMEEDSYDFNLLADRQYQVLLDHQQEVQIQLDEHDIAQLAIKTATQRRSILDFLTSYPFLVPLLIGAK
ncbi:hypothetical protein RR47_GL000950 [Enterococcus columbae DSM 7374 = ATCC 51263]|nr:hypothetical protein RR47_GL000950 [Enterococcus columbae DSM 7374 = ATCC 51263]